MKYVSKYGNNIKHIVRISCFGAEQNTALYDLNKHISREGAVVPHMMEG